MGGPWVNALINSSDGVAEAGPLGRSGRKIFEEIPPGSLWKWSINAGSYINIARHDMLLNKRELKTFEKHSKTTGRKHVSIKGLSQKRTGELNARETKLLLASTRHPVPRPSNWICEKMASSVFEILAGILFSLSSGDFVLNCPLAFLLPCPGSIPNVWCSPKLLFFLPSLNFTRESKII